jgi:hypothetical protein
VVKRKIPNLCRDSNPPTLQPVAQRYTTKLTRLQGDREARNNELYLHRTKHRGKFCTKIDETKQFTLLFSDEIKMVQIHTELIFIVGR